MLGTYLIKPNEVVARWRRLYGTPSWKDFKSKAPSWMLENPNPHTLALAFEKIIKCTKSGEEEEELSTDLGSSLHADLSSATEVGRRAGGGMSTAGSFSVSSGSNTAGNDESLGDVGVVDKALAATAKATKDVAKAAEMKCTVKKSCRMAQANLPQGIKDLSKDPGFQTECLLF